MTLNTYTTLKTKVLICTSDNEVQNLVQNSLAPLISYYVEFQTLEAFLEGSGATNGNNDCDVVIIDVDQGKSLGSDALYSARANLKDQSVIFLSAALDKEQMRHLVRLDGGDWLQKPIESRSLIYAIDQGDTRRVAKTPQNLVHAVLSAGGGAGGSSVAISLTHRLSLPHKRKTSTVAIFDLDFTTASVGAYLNLENRYRLDEVLSTPDRIDLEFLDVIVKKHAQGFSVFSYDCAGLYHSSNASEVVLRILDVISFQHNHIVLDFPAINSPWKDRILSSVDTITIVSGPSIPNLKHAKKMLNHIQSELNSKAKITLTVNKMSTTFFNKFKGRKEIEQIFKGVDVIMLPDDYTTMINSLNQGDLPFQINSRSGFCTGIAGLSKRLATSEGVYQI